MNKNALELHHLKKDFQDFSLHDISFTLPSGFIMGLVGKNGSGKTTIIKLILELLEKKDGTAHIFGNEIHHNYELKEDIAVVFDDLFFVEDWTISDVESAISPFYKTWNTNVFHDFLEKFKLAKQKKVKELSKGMKMKLMLAVALSHNAKLLILDEPTSGLDPVAREELLDILLRYIEDEQHSVLFSTHITSDLDKIADYLTILHEGSVFYTGSKDELFEKYCIVKGGNDEISDEIKQYLIGIQTALTGFSALMDIQHMKHIPSNMLVENATIDDILIHIDTKK